MDYDNYQSLLISVAQAYDAQFSIKTTKKNIQRRVYQQEIIEDNNMLSHQQYGIDTPLS